MFTKYLKIMKFKINTDKILGVRNEIILGRNYKSYKDSPLKHYIKFALNNRKSGSKVGHYE